MQANLGGENISPASPSQALRHLSTAGVLRGMQKVDKPQNILLMNRFLLQQRPGQFLGGNLVEGRPKAREVIWDRHRPSRRPVMKQNPRAVLATEQR